MTKPFLQLSGFIFLLLYSSCLPIFQLRVLEFPEHYSFGDKNVTEQNSIKLTLKNEGMGNLQLKSVKFTGKDLSKNPFKVQLDISGGCSIGLSLKQKDQCQFEIIFFPKEDGDYSYTLNFEFKESNKTYVFPYLVTGKSMPVLKLENATALQFPDVKLTQAHKNKFILKNISSSTYSLKNFIQQTLFENASDKVFEFIKEESTCTNNLILGGGETCHFVIEFGPDKEKVFERDMGIKFISNNGIPVTTIFSYPLKLKGKGILDCASSTALEDFYKKGMESGKEKNQQEFNLGYKQASLLTYSQGEKDGYKSSYDEAYRTAYSSREGEEAGRKAGQAIGFIEGLQDPIICSNGRNDGAARGESEGELEGKREGENLGYAQGLSEGRIVGWGEGKEKGLKECENSPLPQKASTESIGILCQTKGFEKIYSLTSFNQGFEKGLKENKDYQSGYTVGLEKGKLQGAIDGQKQGYKAGHEKGFYYGQILGRQENYQQCYKEAFKTAYEDSYKDSYDRSFQEAKKQGYQEGYEEQFPLGEEEGKRECQK